MNKSAKTNFSSLVHRRLSEVMLFESNDPRFSNVTISRVEASGNLTFAKVFVSIFPPGSHDDLIKSLNNASGFFSRQLGQVLKTRNTPQLYFKYDSGYDHSDEIENLLKVVLQKESNDQRINVNRNK
tara:strand:+ start:225 stop:605 length:381 start_codon:yes stop_codon:yes gene_type:complete